MLSAMNGLEIVETLGTIAIGSSALTWLAKSVFSQMLSRDLEAFKARLQRESTIEIEGLRGELKRLGFEHETRYAKVYEKRAVVLEELFKRLVRANRAFTDRFRTGHLAGEPSLDEQTVKAAEAGNEFVDYFSENLLFIDESLREKVVRVNNHFLNLWRSLAPMPGEDRGRIISDFFEESQPLLDEIRARILEILSPSVIEN
jgi:hypothetical protein